MPYISKTLREALAAGCPARTPGELNYLITCLIRDYVTAIGISYLSINEVVGVLESAKAEFNRRIVTPYEDSKILDNGDVY